MPKPFTFTYLPQDPPILTLLLASRAIVIKGKEAPDLLELNDKPVQPATLDSRGVCTDHRVLCYGNAVTKGRIK